MNTALKYDNSSEWEIHDVSVIGEFNDFDPDKGIMSKENDGWIFEIDLPPGEYYYKFLINGELKLPDPYKKVA